MKEIDIESEDAALIFCFLLIEYVKGTDPELFKRLMPMLKIILVLI